ncbi:MAG: tetratricopeptide repeat protein [Planctomycetes bacterium]|nr:tetratricopeptide repeat protein [Planctomycetota bacterium]MCL4729661.1 tetratricopeptide repeat protein [Planctomycetota bacterium]
MHADLARVYLNYNVLDQALKHFELAINTQLRQTGTEDAELWAGFADALQKAGRKDEAVKAYQRALEIYEKLYAANDQPDRHNYYVQRVAALHAVLGNQAESARWQGMLRADENSASQQLALAMILEGRQKFEEAEARYRRALALTDKDPIAAAEVKLAFAAMLRKIKREAEVEALAREVIAAGTPAEGVKQARRLLFDIYEARGELDKLEFK